MTAASPTRAPIRHVVLLGSSFAAGPQIEPIIDLAAGRSANNYGEIVARELGASITDLAVSGATTQNVLSTSQRAGRQRFAPQLQKLPRDADLVMITAGGNDLGYLQSIFPAVLAARLVDRPITRPAGWAVRRFTGPPTGKPTEVAAAGLARSVQAVRQRAQHARVILVGYPALIGLDTVPGPDLPATSRDLQAIKAIGERLDQAYELAAERTGAELIKTWEISRDHAIGSAEPWVNGVRTGAEQGSVLHPNAAGHRAMARAVLELLDAD